MELIYTNKTTSVISVLPYIPVEPSAGAEVWLDVYQIDLNSFLQAGDVIVAMGSHEWTNNITVNGAPASVGLSTCLAIMNDDHPWQGNPIGGAGDYFVPQSVSDFKINTEHHIYRSFCGTVTVPSNNPYATLGSIRLMCAAQSSVATSIPSSIGITIEGSGYGSMSIMVYRNLNVLGV